MEITTKTPERTLVAKAKLLDISVSTKHCVMISNFLRYKTTTKAKSILERVLGFEQAIPFTRFCRDMGHKPGMAAGRYPMKAVKEFLRLINTVEANAAVKGLDVGNLKISKIIANRAAIPFTGGRLRRGTKRSHLEIEVGSLNKTVNVSKKVNELVSNAAKSNVARAAKKIVKERSPLSEVK